MVNPRCIRRPAIISLAHRMVSMPTSHTTMSRALKPKQTTSSELIMNHEARIASTSLYPKVNEFSFKLKNQLGYRLVFLCRSMLVSQWFLLGPTKDSSQFPW